jgi:hypothetical protein
MGESEKERWLREREETLVREACSGIKRILGLWFGYLGQGSESIRDVYGPPRA